MLLKLVLNMHLPSGLDGKCNESNYLQVFSQTEFLIVDKLEGVTQNGSHALHTKVPASLFRKHNFCILSFSTIIYLPYGE